MFAKVPAAEGVLEVVLVGALGEAVAFVFGDQVSDRAVLGAGFVVHLLRLAGGHALPGGLRLRGC